MKEQKKVKEKSKSEIDPLYLRGYCRVCNRHYFYGHKLDTEHIQVHQHHGGVCQKYHYSCARVKTPVRA
jgi:hypothetical protein